QMDDELTGFVQSLRDLARLLRDDHDPTLKRPTEGVIVKMAATLEAAAGSLRRAGQAVTANADFSPDLKDAKLRVRDLQALLLQAMFHFGGPDGTQDDRVAPMAGNLLPIFAALRTVDRMERAESFIKNAIDYDSGRKPAKAAFATLGSATHNRVKA